jgi:hypothetical protein
MSRLDVFDKLSESHEMCSAALLSTSLEWLNQSMRANICCWWSMHHFHEAKALYAEYRATALRKPQNLLPVIVSGSGKLDLARAIFRTAEVQTIVITTLSG